MRPTCHAKPLAALLAAACSLAAAAGAATEELWLDPAHTRIRFTLGATLHTAEGSVQLARGSLRFDPDAGSAAGEIVMDATGAETGLESRDRNMHRDVLESARYPEIVFHAERLEVTRRDATSADVRLAGSLEMHGATRPFTIPAQLVARGDRIGISAAFRIPYVDWGMVDYSNLLLRVDRFVDVTLEAESRLAGPGSAHQPPGQLERAAEAEGAERRLAGADGEKAVEEAGPGSERADHPAP